MQESSLERVTVHTHLMNLSLQELKNSVDANDIITDPDYQRNYVYDDKRASCLVESILIGIPIPVIYLAEEDESKSNKRLFAPHIKEELFYPGYICKYCGNQILSIDDCEVDHIIPYDAGGPTEIENAQLLHKWCNRSKGSKVQVDSDFEDDSSEDEDYDDGWSLLQRFFSE